MITGHCLCGAVSYRAEGFASGVLACHCSQCRRQSGHYAASIKVDGPLEVTGDIRWYHASPEARRGFCPKCGSCLIWTDHVASWVTAGTLDAPTGLEIEDHIFVADKGDYYEICDGRPQYPGTRHGGTP